MKNGHRCAMLAGLGLITMGSAIGDTGGQPNAMADAINGFTFRLIQKVGTPGDRNLLLSPFSVSCAMGMLLPGTQGADQKALVDAIAPSVSAQQALLGYGTLGKQMTGSYPGLSIANSAWVDRKMKLNAGYVSAIKGGFAAGVFPFSHDQASVDKINTWVSDKTKKRIPTIIDNLKDGDRLILINAVAFDGQWAKQFDKSRTLTQYFHPLGKDIVKVPMMHMNEAVGYMKNPELRAIKLKYKGDAFSMILMLPEHNKDAGALLRKMDPATLNSVLSHFDDSEKLNIAFPKFKFSDSHQLAAPLSGMGLGRLFSEADFSRISPGLMRGKIDRVIHKTFIEVDEQGTKAAAATGVVMQPTAIRVDRPEFIADRPFTFLIIHNPSHAILFGGVVNNPN